MIKSTQIEVLNEWVSSILDSLPAIPSGGGQPSDFDIVVLSQIDPSGLVAIHNTPLSLRLRQLRTRVEFDDDSTKDIHRLSAQNLAAHCPQHVRDTVQGMASEAIKYLRPVSGQQVEALIRSSVPPLFAGRPRYYAEVLLLTAEALLHPEDPMTQTFCFRGTRYFPASSSSVLLLEMAIRQTLEHMSLPAAYRQLRNKTDPALSRADFLKIILNQNRLPLKPEPVNGLLELAPPRLEPWELAAHALNWSDSPMTLAQLREAVHSLIEKHGLDDTREKSLLLESMTYLTPAIRKKLDRLRQTSFVMMGPDTLGLKKHLAAEIPERKWRSIQDHCFEAARDLGFGELSLRELVTGLPEDMRKLVRNSPYLLDGILSQDEARRFKPANRKLYRIAADAAVRAEYVESVIPEEETFLNADETIRTAISSVYRLMNPDRTPGRPGAEAKDPLVLKDFEAESIIKHLKRALIKLQQLTKRQTGECPDLEPGDEEALHLDHEYGQDSNERAGPTITNTLTGRTSSISPEKPFIENPYRPEGLYHIIFQQLLERPSTIKELTSFLMHQKGLSAERVRPYIYVVTSPRKIGIKGDPRGNISAQGHLYYVVKNADKRYRIFPRNPPLPPLKRMHKEKKNIGDMQTDLL